MNIKDLTIEQRKLAVQRLTALWAFSESGLGGVLHGLKVPFTGLVVGGLAIILITFIGYFSQKNYSQIVKSLVIVLLVKAVVSPHTPFPAYIAVSFQAFLAYAVFRLFTINLFSILLLSILAMLESAVQKLAILTLFLGQSFWKAADELVRFISNQLSMPVYNGSQWIIVFYLSIYLIGGILTGLMTYRLITNFSFQNEAAPPSLQQPGIEAGTRNKKKKKRIFVLLSVSVLVSLILFLLTPEGQTRFATINAITWTLTAILVWYIIIAPLFTKLIKHILYKQTDRYSTQVENILSFLPVLNQLTTEAWRCSKTSPVLKRIPVFIKTLLSWSLIYVEPESKP